MTSGFGVDRSSDGLSGTTAADIRKIFGGLYQPGIVSGCGITTSSTDMTYSIAPGVVAIAPTQGEIILAPVAQTTVTTAAAPTTGSRLDIIYAQQRYPSVEGDANVVVSVGATLPARAVELARYYINAGITITNSAVVAGGVNYSVPYGGSLGELHYAQIKNSITLPSSLTRYGQGQINLPTDRMVTWSITACLSAVNATGFDNSKYCEYGFLPNYDGGDWVLWATPGLHQAWQTVNFQNTIVMGRGTHTVNFGILRMVGPGTGMSHEGLDPQQFGRRGIEFRLVDAGPVL